MRSSADNSSVRSSVFSFLADADLGVGDIGVFGNQEVLGRWTLANAACRIILRAVAGAVPATFLLRAFNHRELPRRAVAFRHAAEMGAHTQHHQVLFLAA